MITTVGRVVEHPVRRRVEQLMGMPVSLAVRGPGADDPAVETAWQAVLAELRWVDATFSTYRDDSAVSRINRGELTTAQAPPELREVLELAEAARRDTAGAFDVRYRRAVGDDRLDPSGVVKGWAIERAARHLAALEDVDHCLSGGGDLVCSAAPGRPVWRIGIEDPRRPSALVATVPVRRGAVATSGAAHRGAHVLDARTGRPPVGVASVTVVADSLTAADVDATAAWAQGWQAASWLRGRPGRTGLVVWQDGTRTLIGAEPAA